MSILKTIAWKLMPGEKKLQKLRERGLVIGGGARSSMAMISAPSLILLR